MKFYSVKFILFVFLTTSLLMCTVLRKEYSYINKIKLIKIENSIKKVSITGEYFKVKELTDPSDKNFDFLPQINKIIKQCTSGCVIHFEKGVYKMNGPLHFVNNMHIKLDEGAELVFSDIPDHYLPNVKVRWEGTVVWNYSPLIYAFNKKNISITGKGIINGNGKEWSKNWRTKQKPAQSKLRKMGNDLVPEDKRIFGNDSSYYLRPGLVQLYGCDRVLIEGSTFKNSPFWTLHFPFTNNIIVRNSTIKGGVLNDDGLDPDSSVGVLIENCDIDTHDDAISIKAGRDQDAWTRGGSEKIIIRNCNLKSKTNAFCIGSEMSGGVKNVFVYNCKLNSKEYGINFKANKDRGGSISNVFLWDMKADSVEKALFKFTTNYHSWRGNEFPTSFSDIYLENLTCKYVKEVAFSIEGLPEKPVNKVFLKNIIVEKAGTAKVLTHAKQIEFKNVKVNGEVVN